MGKSFRWKLGLAFLVVIGLLITLLAGIGYVQFKNYYLNNLEARLVKEAYLVGELANYRTNDDGTSRNYQDICIKAARDSSTRVTIIDGDGNVLGDSEVTPDQLENHAARPEVYTALHGGTGTQIRFSDTLGMNMLYVAVPFTNTEVSGVIRMAMPMVDLQTIYSHALAGIVAVALLCGLLALLLSFVIVQYFTRPLREITAAVQEMGAGNLRRRVSWHTDDEMGILARTFNDMGQHIEENVEQISEVKNRLEAILSNTINGIVLVGDEDRLVYANPIAGKLLGWEESGLGRKYAEAIGVYEILTMIDSARSTGQPVKKVVVLYNRGVRTVEANIVPIAKRGSEADDILLVLNDITELKRLEQVRKDFVANVSHELKTPVAAISGFAETLLDEGGIESPETMEFTRIIYDEAQRLAHLINSLLILSRLESEDVELNLHPLELKPLLAENIARMNKLASLKNIRIDFVAPAEAVELTSDPELIDQIMTNLLDNAIKYSPEGSQIEVVLAASTTEVTVQVKDYGIGIPAAELPRVFERFYRVDKARSRKTGGSGLGLAIVRHLAENLHGQVSVTSEIGHGAIFKVVLPR